jgi:glycerol-3-phosphate acyltransferase PlsY
MRGRLADVAGIGAGYLIGSVPVGLLLGRGLRGMDVREHGSHSIGTTNVLRLVGPSAAGATFGLDVAKGSLAVAAARGLGADRTGQAAAGLSAMVGHAWPAFAGFRGGKSVATGFGGMLMITPWGSAFAVVGGLATLAATRVVSVASLSAAGSAALGAALESQRKRDAVPFAFAALATTLVAARHAGNIRRLLRGEEPRVSLKRGLKTTAS